MGDSSEEDRSDTVRFVVEDEAHRALKRKMIDEATKLPSSWKPLENAKTLKADTFAQKNRSAKHIFKKLELSEQDEHEEYGSSLSSTLEHLLEQSLPKEPVTEEVAKERPESKRCSPSASSHSSGSSPMKAVNTKDLRRLQRKAKRRKNSGGLAKILDEEEPLGFRSYSQRTRTKSKAPKNQAKSKRRKRRLLDAPKEDTDRGFSFGLRQKKRKTKISQQEDEDGEESGVLMSSQLARFASASRAKSKKLSPNKVSIKKERSSPRRVRPPIPTIPENDEIIDLVDDDICHSPSLPVLGNDKDGEDVGTASQWFAGPSQSRQMLTPAVGGTTKCPPPSNSSRKLRFGSSMKKSYVKDFRRRAVKGKMPPFRMDGSIRILEWYELAIQRLSQRLGEFAHWNMKEEENIEETGLDPFAKNYIKVLVLHAQSDGRLFRLKCSITDSSACVDGAVATPPKPEVNLVFERPMPGAAKATRAKQFRTLDSLDHLQEIYASADFVGKSLKVFAPWLYLPGENTLICTSLILNEGHAETNVIPPSPVVPVEPRKDRKLRIKSSFKPASSTLPTLNNQGLLEAKELIGTRRVDCLNGTVICSIPRDDLPLDYLSADKSASGVPPGTICSSILLRLEPQGEEELRVQYAEVLISPIHYRRYRALFEAPCGSRVEFRRVGLVALPVWSTNDDAAVVNWESLYAFSKQAKDGKHWTLDADEKTSFVVQDCPASSVTEVVTSVEQVYSLIQGAIAKKRVSIICTVKRVAQAVLGVGAVPSQTGQHEFEIKLHESRIRAAVHRHVHPGSIVLLKHVCVEKGICTADGNSVVELVCLSGDPLPKPSYVLHNPELKRSFAWSRRKGEDGAEEGSAGRDSSESHLGNSIIQSVPAAKTLVHIYSRVMKSSDFGGDPKP